LYEPGSGPPVQLHDFNGGVQPSGLFWVVELAEDEVQISSDGRRASMHAEDVPVIDSFQFGGLKMVPAKVSFSVEWQAKGPAKPLGKGKSVPPNDPAAFIGEFAPAVARGSYAGRELAFSFKSDPGASSDPLGYAEMGHERNGVFI
jgi:hypothetical protein